jgi:CheY-like chemotaxis protein
MEAVGTLAGGIAHDFNNLLQAIQGNAELLLLERKNSGAGYQELLEITRAAKRGGELTRQLLAYSRKIESNLQLTDLNRAVKNLTSLVGRTLPRMIQLEFHLAANLPLVNADPSQIEQVLMNLVVNARDAMTDEGTLSIRTEKVILDEGYTRIHPEVAPGEYVSLAVSDNGHGMDTDTQSKIFDPFFTTKEVRKGTGLGLAMVFGIVKTHGGHIECESEPGEGTTFKLYLPAAVVVSETAQDAKPEKLKGGTETILVVDDEIALRNFSQQLLKKFGYTVLCAEDGEDALHLFEQQRDRIDLVILDLIMPGMGGRRCLKKILEIDPRARVIIVSGYSTRGPGTQEVVEGAISFIKKPFAIPDMLKAIRQALDASPLYQARPRV